MLGNKSTTTQNEEKSSLPNEENSTSENDFFPLATLLTADDFIREEKNSGLLRRIYR